MEINQAEEKKKRFKNKDSLRDLWNNVKHTRVHIIRVPEREEREKGAENIFEDIIAENFPKVEKKIDIQVQENSNPNRSTSRHIVVKMAKN